MLHTLDYVVIGVYLIVLLAICVRVTRSSPDVDELFLAGRTLGPAVIGFSLFASNISSTTLIGLPGAAWEHGISVANYEWMAGLVLVKEAGGQVNDFFRNDGLLLGNPYLVACPGVYPQLAEMIGPSLDD